MAAKTIICCCIIYAAVPAVCAQSGDSTHFENNRERVKTREQQYNAGNGRYFIYSKPRPFGFITQLPKDAVGIVETAFTRRSIKPLLLVAGTTVLFSFADETASDAVHQFSSNIHLHAEEDYKNVWQLKVGKTQTSLIKAPRNINTALYEIGQGFPSLLIGGGLFAYGKIHNNYRALSTASQLAETFILMGVGTQFLKRITGRQSPSEVPAEADGSWHPFPAFSQYQQHTPNFDAFPSGHLATLMSTLTVLFENYPEKKWIKPVGYSVIGLVGYSMINNNVHWLSDYPLAIALGYLCGKQVVKHNRKVDHTYTTKKHSAALSYTINYANSRVLPGIVYKF
jgi:hypothetical protein